MSKEVMGAQEEEWHICRKPVLGSKGKESSLEGKKWGLHYTFSGLTKQEK